MGLDEIVNFGRKSFCYLACKIYGLFSAAFDLSLFVSGKVCECGVSFFFGTNKENAYMAFRSCWAVIRVLRPTFLFAFFRVFFAGKGKSAHVFLFPPWFQHMLHTYVYGCPTCRNFSWTCERRRLKTFYCLWLSGIIIILSRKCIKQNNIFDKKLLSNFYFPFRVSHALDAVLEKDDM